MWPVSGSFPMMREVTRIGPTRHAVGIGAPWWERPSTSMLFCLTRFSYDQRANAKPMPVSAGVR